MRMSLRAALGYIKSSGNADGGWGYRPGGGSFVEPTGFAMLALSSHGDRTAAERGLSFLRACQRDSGAVGINPADPEGSWMAYAALLAFHALGPAAEERRLRDWILSFEDASGRFSPEDVASIAALYHYDATIRGWSWTPLTTAWVEPTALFIIALVRAGVPPGQEVIRSGVKLILNRKVMSGGWNFGNPASKSRPLEASLMSTALALAALGAAGQSEGRPVVSEGLDYLARALADDVSTASLAWSLLALRSFPSMASRVPDVAARLASLQAENGSFRDNPFETALAVIVLTEPGALLLPQGRIL